MKFNASTCIRGSVRTLALGGLGLGLQAPFIAFSKLVMAGEEEKEDGRGIADDRRGGVR